MTEYTGTRIIEEFEGRKHSLFVQMREMEYGTLNFVHNVSPDINTTWLCIFSFEIHFKIVQIVDLF